MKLLATCSLLLIGLLAQAQTPATPETTMQQWIATQDTAWLETFAREVTAPFDAEMAKVAQSVTAALEANLARARAAGDLDQTLIWQTEKDRFAAEKAMPAEDEATTAPALKQVRTAWRTPAARLEKERSERARAVQARYDQVLAQAQKQLTQQARIDDALMVKKKREEMAAGLAPPWRAANQPPAPVAPVTPSRPVPSTPLPATAGLKSKIEDILTSKPWVHREKFEYTFKKDGHFSLAGGNRTGTYQINETTGFVAFTWDAGTVRGEGVQYDEKTRAFTHNRGGTFVRAKR